MNNLELYIDNTGDYSVGISGFSCTIKIGCRDFYDVFDSGFSDRLEKFLLAELDCHAGKTTIRTNDEYDDYL